MNKELNFKVDENKCIGCGICTYTCTSKIDVKKFVETAKLIVKRVK